MQQRQPRLGDILDDYCPRERRVTNHAVVAMIGGDVKQTRCTTCDAEHEYKHAKIPRQRRKADTPAALYAQVAANGPKRVAHEASQDETPHDAASMDDEAMDAHESDSDTLKHAVSDNGSQAEYASADAEQHDAASRTIEDEPDAPEPYGEGRETEEEGPVHRPLIRASLPRPEGQQPPARPIPEFTIRQPAGRPGRFRPRHQRGGGQQFHGGNRGNGNFAGPRGGGGMRTGRRHDGGQHRKRSK
jgi:hypothetical protein